MNCYQCRGTGWVTAIHGPRGYIYGFRCGNCDTKRLSEFIPRWENKFAHTFKVDFDTGIKPIKIIPEKVSDQKQKPDYKAIAANPKDFDLGIDLEDAPF